jgi:hypothetical protein
MAITIIYENDKQHRILYFRIYRFPLHVIRKQLRILYFRIYRFTLYVIHYTTPVHITSRLPSDVCATTALTIVYETDKQHRILYFRIYHFTLHVIHYTNDKQLRILYFRIYRFTLYVIHCTTPVHITSVSSDICATRHILLSMNMNVLSAANNVL